MRCAEENTFNLWTALYVTMFSIECGAVPRWLTDVNGSQELLEEVEQDEQACEAAARSLPGTRGARRARGRRALPHSNSLQDLVAALAAEPAPRRPHVRHAPAPAPSTVSARAIHGGSLPSGVDTCEYLITVSTATCRTPTRCRTWWRRWRPSLKKTR